MQPTENDLDRFEDTVGIRRVSIHKERRHAACALAKSPGTLDHDGGIANCFRDSPGQYQAYWLTAGTVGVHDYWKKSLPHFNPEWIERIDQQWYPAWQIDQARVGVENGPIGGLAS